MSTEPELKFISLVLEQVPCRTEDFVQCSPGDLEGKIPNTQNIDKMIILQKSFPVGPTFPISLAGWICREYICAVNVGENLCTQESAGQPCKKRLFCVLSPGDSGSISCWDTKNSLFLEPFLIFLARVASCRGYKRARGVQQHVLACGGKEMMCLGGTAWRQKCLQRAQNKQGC